MGAKKIRKKKVISISEVADGPLDWIRTDDKNMVDSMYILCVTRGLYPVLEALREALKIEAQACTEWKIPMNTQWEADLEFCTEADTRIGEMITELTEKWAEAPNMARRHETQIGGLYPLPGNGIYRPKR